MICLSFDTDHMDETRMVEFLGSVPVPGRGTFFCTRRFRCLEGRGHEIGPHPLLGEGVDWGRELDEKRATFPEARGWRSHACVFSHALAERVARQGYRYVSTHDDFGRPRPQPHRHCWGVWQMPIYYMDNLDFSRLRFWPDRGERPFSAEIVRRAMDGGGVYVFDFHPIHLLLNTDRPESYFERRDRFRAGDSLETLRVGGAGVLVFYETLVDAMERRGLVSHGMEEALDGFTQSHPGA